MSGWIKIHRRILEWEWYDDANTMRLFLHLLLTVNHKDKKWRGQVIKSGELITSIANLAEQTGLSIQQTRTALDKLKSTSQLTNKSTNKYSLISMSNWDSFQVNDKQDNKQITNEQQTNNKQITTTKECKKYKNSKKEDLSVNFEEFWKSYLPYEVSKGSKKEAKEKFINILKKGKIDYEQIKQGLIKYIEYCHFGKIKTKQVHRWLAKEGWDDEYPDQQTTLYNPERDDDPVERAVFEGLGLL